MVSTAVFQQMPAECLDEEGPFPTHTEALSGPADGETEQLTRVCRGSSASPRLPPADANEISYKTPVFKIFLSDWQRQRWTSHFAGQDLGEQA